MARPSGGTIPPQQTIMDANQAIALLDTLHHWASTRVNDSKGAAGYSITITHAGRRVTARRRLFVDAVVAAMAKLREPKRKNKPDKAPHVLRLAD